MSSLIGSTPLPRRSFVLGSFAAAASVAMVSACGSGGSGSSGAQTLALSTQNPDVESADPATWAILQGFAAAHPEVSIDVSGQAVAEHLQSLSIAAQSDTLPDIFWIYQHTAEQMSSSGILLDLGPIVDELGITDRIASSTIESFTNDAGRLYGVPYQSLLTGLWCNTALFEEHGVAIPTTFDELLDVTRTFAAAGVTTISDGANQSSFSVWSFLTWLSRFGFDERIAGILDGSDTYTNDDFRRCYQHIDELRDAGAFASNVSTQTYQQAVDSFVNGRAAMLDAGVWAAGAIQASDIAGTIDFWKGPEFSDGVGDQNIIMNVPSAPFSVDHKVGKDEGKLTALKAFLGYYYSDEAQQLMADNGQPPVMSYTPTISDEQTALKAALAAATADGVTSPPAQPDLLVSTSVANSMYDSIYGVIQGQMTPSDALDLVQSSIESE